MERYFRAGFAFLLAVALLGASFGLIRDPNIPLWINAIAYAGFGIWQLQDD